jgi:hypothetical protein
MNKTLISYVTSNWRCQPWVLVFGLTGSVVFGMSATHAQDVVEPACAETSGATEFPFSRLLRMIAKGCDNEPELWREISSSPFLYKSSIERCPFQFDCFIFGRPTVATNPNQRALVRFLLQSRDACGAVVFVSHDNLPYRLLAHETALETKEIEWIQKSDSVRFGFVVDQDHPIEHFDSKAAPKDVRDFIVFDSAGFLKDLMDDREPQVKWHQTARMLQLRKSSHTHAEIRFRTPNDQLRYGTVLSELRVETKEPFIQCYRGFLQQPHQRMWLETEKRREIAGRLDQLNRPFSAEEVRRTGSLFPKGEEPALRMWHELLPCWSAPAETFSPASVRALVDVRKSVLVTLLALERFTPPGAAAADDKDETARRLDANLVAMMVANCLESSCNALARHLVEGETYPDDPIMIARELESTVGPWEYNALRMSGAHHLLESGLLLPDQRAALLHALGVSGAPPNYFLHLLADDVVNGDFEQCIVRAHWQLHCEEKHVRACFEAIRAAAEGTARQTAAVETLILLDRVAQIPGEVMTKWYQGKIVEDPAGRWRRLSLLSRHPSGRKFLTQRLANCGDEPLERSTCEEAWSILQARAKATLYTSRFDFMPESECRHFVENSASK